MAESRPSAAVPQAGEPATELCRFALAARDGDAGALASLLRGLQDTLWRYCLSQLGDPGEAEEATQEAAARIVAAVGSFRGGSKAETWAIGVALNVCRERRRQRQRAGGPLPEDEADNRPPPDARAAAAEQSAAVRDLIQELPDRQREAIVLRYFQQLSIEETASAMQCQPGTVKATLWQALRRMRRSSRLDPLNAEGVGRRSS